jgi:hypothetical protein
VSAGQHSVIRPLLFGARRLRARPLQLLLIALPLAAAAAVIGASSIVAALSFESSVRGRVASEPAPDRAIVVKYSLDPQGSPSARRTHASRTLAMFRESTFAPVRVQIYDPIAPPDQSGVRLVVVPDEAVSAVDVTSGLLPRGCRGLTCEALALSPRFPQGQLRVVGRVKGKPVRLKIVGAGSLRERALPDQETLVGNEVLVPAIAGPLVQPLRESGSTVVHSAVLEPGAVHGAELRSLAERMRVAAVRLGRTDPLFAITMPTDLLHELAHIGDVARNRLLIVASQGAALLLAFAAFVAASRRRDVDQLRLQLETLGASRRQIALARAGEVVLPTVLALALVLVGLWIALVAITAIRDLRSNFGTQALPVSTLLAIVALGVVATLILLAATAPVARTRLGVGVLEVGALSALAVVVWQATATRGLDPNRIAGGDGVQPVLLLVPALAVFVAGVVLLRILPFVFRLAERLARRAPTSLRLALLSAARNPGQAAATTTFLAVALGSALFSVNYRGSLDRQAEAAAAFTTGAAARASTVGAQGTHDASPLLRRQRSAIPVLRLGGTVVEEGTAGQQSVTVVGVPPHALRNLLGWQERFSDLTRAQIATRVRPKSISLTGPPLPRGASSIRLWARQNSAPVRRAVLHLVLPGHGFATLPLGELRRNWHLVEAPVPAGLSGARLIGIEFPVASGGTTGVIGALPGGISGNVTESNEALEFGGLAARVKGGWRNLPSLADWTGARAPDFEGAASPRRFDGAPIAEGIHFILSGTSVPLVRPRVELRTAGTSAMYALPALAGPDPAGVAVDGRVTVDLLGHQLRFRTIGRASLFPTITDSPRGFLVVDYDALFTAMNADAPGTAPASEAWFFDPQEALRLPEYAQVTRLEEERARRFDDPLAAGARRLLTWTGVAAALLALLGLALSIRVALGVERQVLAEYEALGVGPRALGRSIQLRLVFLCLLGLVAAVAGGALAARAIASLVAVTATAGAPLPPIRAVVDWQQGGFLVVAVATAAVLAAATLAARTLREATGRRLRR